MTTSSKLTGKRILVTGASGFIGSHLCVSLARLGAEVFGVSRNPPAEITRGVHWQATDLSDLNAARRIVRKVHADVIFHLCSHAQGERDLSLVWPTLHSDVIAAVNVLTSATSIGFTRLIMAGSLEEPDPGDIASSPYAAAKAVCRIYARMFNSLYQAPIVLARIFMVYGPGQPRKKLIPYCIHTLSQHSPLQIASPRRKVDWIYIDDVVQGLLAVASAPGVEGLSLDLGSGKLVEVREVVNRIRRLMKSDDDVEFGSLPSRPREVVRRANIAFTTARTGWHPRVSLDSGLEATIKNLRLTNLPSMSRFTRPSPSPPHHP